jgi:hypothetical protein
MVIAGHRVALSGAPKRDNLGLPWPRGFDGELRDFGRSEVARVLHVGYDSPEWEAARPSLDKGSDLAPSRDARGE